MSKYSLVLVDMDGTLIDSDQMFIKAIRKIHAKYGRGPTPTDTEILMWSGPSIEDIIAHFTVNVDIDLAIKEYYVYAYEFFSYIILYPHAKEVLHKLKENGITLGIVSNKRYTSACDIIKSLKIDDLFTIIVASGKVKTFKPNPEGMLLAMKEAGVTDKSKVIYLGDNDSDYETCKNAGIDCLLVHYGDRKLYTTDKAKYYANGFDEIGRILLDE